MFHQKPYRTHYDYEKGRTIDMEWGGRLTDLPALSLPSLSVSIVAPSPSLFVQSTRSIHLRHETLIPFHNHNTIKIE